MKTSKGEKIFLIINNIFMVLLGFLCFAPLVHIFAVSFSDNAAVAGGLVTFWPRQFTTFAYEYIMDDGMFWGSMRTSVLRTIVGWAVNITLTILVAYPLSKSSSRFKARTFFAWFVFIPMIINGGLIPNYMLIKEVGLIDNFFALIFPMAVPVFYVLVMLSFFRSMPIELEESALIDGASQWKILFRIYVPLSLPAVATITVYVMVIHWNMWFDGLIYMNNPEKYPLMTYLQTAVLNINWDNLTAEEAAIMSKLGGRSYKAAQMFLGALPILAAYPFLQKYFVKGLVLGSVKG